MATEITISDGRYADIWARVHSVEAGQVSDSLRAALSGEAFESHVQSICTTFPNDIHRTVRDSHDLSYEGLLASRSDQLCDAAAALDAAHQLVRSLPSEHIARDVAASTFFAARGYYNYKNELPALARADLRSANCADVKLLQQELGVFHLHRIQLVHNTARIEQRFGSRSEALHLVEQAICHASGLAAEIPVLQGPWSARETDGCDPDILAAMICQLLKELRRWNSQ